MLFAYVSIVRCMFTSLHFTLPLQQNVATLEDLIHHCSISHADGTWDHVSETLIMHVKAGQHVWLQRGSDQSVTKSIRGGHWTTFSGFLIRADP